jgi:hypothetical protein
MNYILNRNLSNDPITEHPLQFQIPLSSWLLQYQIHLVIVFTLRIV